MKRIDVISSTIKSIGWEENKLEVEFQSGRIYLYDDIPLDTFQKIRISQSVGKTLRQDVINIGKIGKKIYDPNQRE